MMIDGIEIYKCDAFSVYINHVDPSDEFWVSFGPADRMAFGEAYFKKIRKPAAMFVMNEARWYQHSEIEEALQLIKEILSRHSGRIICYGSSMGGFAALAFSGKLDATHIIVSAPQISINPELVGSFDQRWSYLHSTNKYIYTDARCGIFDKSIVTIIVDPLLSVDRKHAELIKFSHDNTRILKFPNAGHSCLQTLNRMGVLQSLMKCINDDDATLETAYKFALAEYKTKRSKSSHYFSNAALNYFSRGKFVEGRRWMIKAVELDQSSGDKYLLTNFYLKEKIRANNDEANDFIICAYIYALGGKVEQAVNVLVEAETRHERSASIKTQLDLYRNFDKLIGVYCGSVQVHNSALQSENIDLKNDNETLRRRTDNLQELYDGSLNDNKYLRELILSMQRSLIWRAARSLIVLKGQFDTCIKRIRKRFF